MSAKPHLDNLSHREEFTLVGMNCQGCVRRVTEALQAVPGVARVTVQLKNSRAQIHWQPSAMPSHEAILHAAKRAGYPATLVTSSPTATASPSRWSPLAGWQFNVTLGTCATLPLLAGEWLFGWGAERWFQWLAFGLALPVQLLGGARFYRGAWYQLRSGSANMDTLVALGSTTAFAFSVWLLFSGVAGHTYFMEAAAIITLISVGHWLEANLSAHAASSLRALLKLAPTTARLLDATGVEREISVAALQVGDHVVLRPGDQVPTDGEVLSGHSTVTEAMLTGEALPVEKSVGAKLYGGTMNQNGRLVLRVTATGDATALAHIIAVVQRAQSSRANIQKLGDRVSAVFVPVVVLLALATGLWWGFAFAQAQAAHTALAPFLWPSHLPPSALAAAFIHAAAVLIVACPCAMGLATPAAIMAGTNVAARRGILIRDAEALEKSGRITAVAFDKTGTLTQGQFVVAATAEFNLSLPSAPTFSEMATALAQNSQHPLSRAIAAANSPIQRANLPPLNSWQEVPGGGVQAQWENSLWRLGSLVWLRKSGVDARAVVTFASEWSAQGATILGVACERECVGAFALRDELKPRAMEVVRTLCAQGQKVFLVTGDHAATASAIAQQAGIARENVFAEIRPEQKAEIVRTLQARGERVAFVGDGINDAPALEQADLGIAVSRASDVARAAADVILLHSDIEAIPEALALAQATLRTIRQNLFWAFFYNAAAVPLAALGFLSPVLCAAAMGLSDVLVIGNALRLRGWVNRKSKTNTCENSAAKYPTRAGTAG